MSAKWKKKENLQSKCDGENSLIPTNAAITSSKTISCSGYACQVEKKYRYTFIWKKCTLNLCKSLLAFSVQNKKNAAYCTGSVLSTAVWFPVPRDNQLYDWSSGTPLLQWMQEIYFFCLLWLIIYWPQWVHKEKEGEIASDCNSLCTVSRLWHWSRWHHPHKCKANLGWFCKSVRKSRRFCTVFPGKSI